MTADAESQMLRPLNRRELVSALGAGLALSFGRTVHAAGPIYLGDMHYHLFFGGTYPSDKYPLGPDMRGGQATLVAWSLVSDLLWMGPAANRYRQKAIPKDGEVYGWFQREVARIKRHVTEQNLNLVRDAADVDGALNGD